MKPALAALALSLLLGLPAIAQAQLRSQVIATGLTNPVAFVADPIDSATFFVIEQRGTIRTVRNGSVSSTFFLDVRSTISAGGERGLLGLAFPPGRSNDAALFRDVDESRRPLRGRALHAYQHGGG